MTEEEIHVAAERDPDAKPRAASELRSVRRVSRVKTLRKTMRLTQEEFAARYLIPLGTLRDWEQGCSEPDQPAKAYLRAIAGDPVAVFQALQCASDATRREALV